MHITRINFCRHPRTHLQEYTGLVHLLDSCLRRNDVEAKKKKFQFQSSSFWLRRDRCRQKCFFKVPKRGNFALGKECNKLANMCRVGFQLSLEWQEKTKNYKFTSEQGKISKINAVIFEIWRVLFFWLWRRSGGNLCF